MIDQIKLNTEGNEFIYLVSAPEYPLDIKKDIGKYQDYSFLPDEYASNAIEQTEPDSFGRRSFEIIDSFMHPIYGPIYLLKV